MNTPTLGAQTPTEDQADAETPRPRDHTAVNWAGDPEALTIDQLHERLRSLATSVCAILRPYSRFQTLERAEAERVLDLWEGCRTVLLDKASPRAAS